jgi:dienelactone hydrolase
MRIQLPHAALEGDLTVPPGAQSVVLFAHGSGSSRRSPRNQFVARALNGEGFATFLFDLLTAEEEHADDLTARLRFDIGMLSQRLAQATDWLAARHPAFQARMAYFGASTGAAAALVAAAERHDVFAVVSRGGRPDLAGPILARVQTPVLLIVGGNDPEVVELNRRALHAIHAPCELSIVPGATHLFEEPGTLAQVAAQAAHWFAEYEPAAPRKVEPRASAQASSPEG